MTVHLKNFEVVYPGHNLHGQHLDFVIKNGVFQEIGKNISLDKKSICIENGCLTPGWLDVGTTLSTPGFEHRDSVKSLLDSAAAGGFTEILVFPNTEPVIDNAATITAVKQLSANHAVKLHIAGAVTKHTKGTSLAEMHDMHLAGAKAFSDGNHSIENEGNLLRALQYSRATQSTIINQSKLTDMAPDWQMNEGDVNITLGLPGQHQIIEQIAIDRDINICKYADGRLLIHQVSTPESIKKIQKSKAKTAVFSSINYLHLVANESALHDFDSNWKIDPPLRSETTRVALVKQVAKGNVDIICSGHLPLDTESKKLEFTEADHGALGLQTLYPALQTYASNLGLDQIVSCLAINPRQIFNIELPTIEEGAVANITILDKNGTSQLDKTTNHSLSANSPYWDKPLKGKILGIFANKTTMLNK